MSEMDEFKHIFFTEATELLVDMEERLLKLEEGSQDIDQLNAIFRCAHSIKGGSGAFGLDAIMRFTHKLEALLDCMRSGTLVPQRDSINVLLKSVDIVNQMLAAAQENRDVPAGFGDDVVAQLDHFAGGAGSTPAPLPIAPALPIVAPQTSDSLPSTSGKWHYVIQFKPHKHMLATGNEPLLILRELARLGDADVQADTNGIPSLTDFDPVCCYLGWTITLDTEAAEEAVKEVFEFVSDLAEITITAEEISAPSSSPMLEVAAEIPDEFAAAPVQSPPRTGVRSTRENGSRQRCSSPRCGQLYPRRYRENRPTGEHGRRARHYRGDAACTGAPFARGPVLGTRTRDG